MIYRKEHGAKYEVGKLDCCQFDYTIKNCRNSYVADVKDNLQRKDVYRALPILSILWEYFLRSQLFLINWQCSKLLYAIVIALVDSLRAGVMQNIATDTLATAKGRT